MKKHCGFGSTERVHADRYKEHLRSVLGFLESAERAFRNGDCDAGMDAASGAFEAYGEARGHRDALPSTNLELGIKPERWIDIGRRLNFLRQAMKQCGR